jgi:hypothetical protein
MDSSSEPRVITFSRRKKPPLSLLQSESEKGANLANPLSIGGKEGAKRKKMKVHSGSPPSLFFYSMGPNSYRFSARKGAESNRKPSSTLEILIGRSGSLGKSPPKVRIQAPKPSTSKARRGGRRLSAKRIIFSFCIGSPRWLLFI